MRVPDFHELLAALYGDQVVEGQIIDVSESGDAREGYAVVQLVGIDKPVVVLLGSVAVADGPGK